MGTFLQFFMEDFSIFEPKFRPKTSENFRSFFCEKKSMVFEQNPTRKNFAFCVPFFIDFARYIRIFLLLFGVSLKKRYL